MSEITALVHTHNSEHTLERLLDSVSWADAIIAVDMASTHQTLGILESRGCEIHHVEEQPWNDELRNAFLDKPRTPWTLVIDSDEHLSEDAEQLCRDLVHSAETNTVGFALPRYNHCFGRVLRGDRWYPDRQVRLFRTNSVSYLRKHHSHPVPKDENAQILYPDLGSAPHIHHDSYESIAGFVAKQQAYALTDDYAGEVDWSDYTKQAIEHVLAANHAPSAEEHAAEILLATDVLQRAFIHWEKNGRIEKIPEFFGWAFGVFEGPGRVTPTISPATREIESRLSEAEAEVKRMKKTLSWRLTFPLRLVGLGMEAIRSAASTREQQSDND